MTEETDKLIPYFVPSLSAVLIAAEDEKGLPLDYDEVVSIRDNAACIMMKIKNTKKMDESRGYVDVNPENLWYEWQMLRREMNRKPDLDPGPSFAQMNSNSSEYQQAVELARSTLGNFRQMLPSDGSSRFDAMIKTKLVDGENEAYMWLANTCTRDNDFLAEIYDVPEFFQNVEIGQEFRVGRNELVDWMVNDDGTLYGGFTLRYHRSTLSKAEQDAFDEHVGVSRYV